MSQRDRDRDRVSQDTRDMFRDLGRDLEGVLDRALQNTFVKSKRGVKDVLGAAENDIRRLAANIISEQLFHPLMEQVFGGGGGAGGAGGAWGGGGGGQTPVSSLLGVLGAGVAGGIGGGSFASGVGSALGMAVAGPLGAALGGVVGSLVGEIGKSEPMLISSFNLLWEEVDGQVRRVTDSWVNMSRDGGLVSAAEKFVQSQVDFFEKLAIVAGGEELPKFSFALSGQGIDDIARILKQTTASSMATSAFQGFGALSEVFGSGFTEDFREIFMDTMSQGLGHFVFGQARETLDQYLAWKFGQLASMPGEQAGASFEAWIGGQSIFSPVGRPGIRANSIFELFQGMHPGVDFSNPANFPQLEEFAGTVTPGWFSRGEIAFGSEKAQAPWEDFFTDLEKQVGELFDMVTGGMGKAFTASLKTGEYQSFEDGFKSSILAAAQQDLITGFAEQELLPLIFAPFYGQGGAPGFTEILKQYRAGDLSLAQAEGGLTPLFADFAATLAGFEPVWGLLNTSFQSLAQALGLNTAAVGGNTAAVLGPVNSFLASLDTGPLAAVQSLAGISGLGNKLYTAAFADPGQFGAYSQFMTQSWLPYLQGTSGNYADVVAGVRGQVEAMPWVAQARGLPAAAADIGAAVAAAVAPMLLDIRESLGPITIQVVVDGQVVKQQVIQSLDDPAVVQKARSRG